MFSGTVVATSEVCFAGTTQLRNVIGIVLAAATALGWGGADFFGGEASRDDAPVMVVVALGELLGVVLLVPVLAARGVSPPLEPRLGLAAVAGVAVTVELSLIYRALSRGNVFVTAPTGALGAVGAVGAGLVGGDALGLGGVVGIAAALLGAGVTAWSPAEPTQRARVTRRESVLTCLGAATAVAAALTALHAAGRLDPTWATATEHLSTAASAGMLAVVSGRRRHEGSRCRRHEGSRLPQRAQLPTIALVAALGVGADLAYASASHYGTLAVTSAVASLYPLSTIALGLLLRGRHATRLQVLGVVLALGGAVLLALSTG